VAAMGHHEDQFFHINQYGSVSKPCTPGEHQNSGKWMFIPLKMVLIGIDPYPYEKSPPTA